MQDFNELISEKIQKFRNLYNLFSPLDGISTNEKLENIFLTSVSMRLLRDRSLMRYDWYVRSVCPCEKNIYWWKELFLLCKIVMRRHVEHFNILWSCQNLAGKEKKMWLIYFKKILMVISCILHSFFSLSHYFKIRLLDATYNICLS